MGKTILERAWTRETSSDPEHWSEENPAWGQCAITALLAQDLFGGQLLRAMIQGQNHYWNLLPNGAELDLTRQQFGPNPSLDPGEVPKIRDREYVLSFPATVKRYELLKQNILKLQGAL